ncbi:MAG: CPBP family intramembrane metalloprotease [Oscillospiraceae bacterium]|nr:CPBP family intramembrane metalloprotease [Oscillospiraceae bacterium]
MEAKIKKHPILGCVVIFSICGLARVIEYFVIRTDETLISENFLHKAFGIMVLAVVLYLLHSSWQSIGFVKNEIASGMIKGLALGGSCFVIAYSVECLILYWINQNVSLSFYISGFSLVGETAKHNSILFLALCIVFNIINVWMEEGVFRGLLMKILAERLSFTSAVLFIAFLFGIWHWVMPLRDYMEENISLANLLIMGIGYIILAGIMSIKWSLLYRITGTLWMGLGDHLFNNVIVTNLLHVVSNHEADSMQIVRILIGQILSFSIVMLYYRKTIKTMR